MAKGRPTDPRRAKRATGNRPLPGEVAHAPGLPVEAEVLEADPPADLPAEVHDVWRVAVAEMGGNRHLRPVDLVQLKVWCEAVWVHAQASANVHKFGVLVKGASGPIANPMLRVQKDAAATIRQVSDVLGLNPLARIHAGLMQVAGAGMVMGIRERLEAKTAKGGS